MRELREISTQYRVIAIYKKERTLRILWGESYTPPVLQQVYLSIVFKIKVEPMPKCQDKAAEALGGSSPLRQTNLSLANGDEIFRRTVIFKRSLICLAYFSVLKSGPTGFSNL